MKILFESKCKEIKELSVDELSELIKNATEELSSKEEYQNLLERRDRFDNTLYQKALRRSQDTIREFEERYKNRKLNLISTFLQDLFKTIFFRTVSKDENLGEYFNFTTYVSPTEDYANYAIKNEYFSLPSQQQRTWTHGKFKEMLKTHKTIYQMSEYIYDCIELSKKLS